MNTSKLKKHSVVPVATTGKTNEAQEKEIKDGSTNAPHMVVCLNLMITIFGIIFHFLIYHMLSSSPFHFVCPEGFYVKGYSNGTPLCGPLIPRYKDNHTAYKNVESYNSLNSELNILSTLKCNGNEILKRSSDGNRWECGTNTATTNNSCLL